MNTIDDSIMSLHILTRAAGWNALLQKRQPETAPPRRSIPL